MENRKTNVHDVVVVGSCNIDLISYVQRFPTPGETICGTKFTTGCGGKGANQCVMAAKLGARTAMIGCVGDDNFGAMYRDNFETLHVNTEHLHTINDVTTGVAPITVTDDGENSIVIVKGANDHLNLAHLQQAENMIASARIVLCQLEIDFTITLAALKLAKSKGVTTLFNPAPAVKGLSPEYLQNSTILCCNETEAEILTNGNKIKTDDERRKAVQCLLSKGPQFVVLTLGASGAMIGSNVIGGGDVSSNVIGGAGGEVPEVPHVTHVQVPEEYRVTKVVDTTGAGDCFVGSLAYFLSQRTDLTFEEKVRRAVSIASVSVTKPGTQISYPTADELPESIMH